MKDRLEEFIRQNRTGFDVHDPGDAIWSKIDLPGKERSARRQVFRIITRIAAVVVIFAASWALNDYLDYRDKISSEKQADQFYQLVPELKETENYYNNLVSIKMNELQPWFNRVPGLDHEVNGDLGELDSVYASLKQDLRDNIDNEQVIEAMIQNYRMKLEILEDLLNELNTENNTVQHETQGSAV
ncbi:MAG TPA: hypothetical protein VE870_07790 [Bacteroidales bacterium]|nr:hypothetical protein [Bacteroidales bacterium]